MGWNDPGNGKDPWKRRDGDEAADLDRIVRNWQRRLSAIFGGKGGGGRATGSGGAGGAGGWLIGIVVVGIWLATGLYRVDEAERGVVQRFGAYTVTTMPGLHWHWPFPIETVDVVNTNAVSNYSFQTEILAADRKYVFVDMVVQYTRSEPRNFLFEVVRPEETLQHVTESALREVVGTSTLEALVTKERGEIVPRTLEILQSTLRSYNAGITVTSISLEQLDYPQAVQGAVDDTQKAGNDRQTSILEAQTYAGNIIPRARGQAARIREDAEAYRDRVIANAEGDAARFTSVLREYQQAPRVTRERMYIEALEEVYGNTNKVIVDTDGSGNLLYLPIDKLMETPRSGPRDPDDGDADSSRTSSQQQGVSTSADEQLSRGDRRTRQ